MTTIFRKNRLHLVLCFWLAWLMVACQPETVVPTQTVVASPTHQALPGLTVSPTATHLTRPTFTPAPQLDWLIFVKQVKERPDEMPVLPRREDGFAESSPWEIAPAFVPAAGMRFIALEICAVNVDETSWSFNPAKLLLAAVDGQLYPARLGRVAQGLSAFELHRGQQVRGWVVFELPEAAKPQKVVYQIPSNNNLSANLVELSNLANMAPETVSTTSDSDFGLTLRLLEIKDPGEPFSTFAYTYLAGHRPVNINVEVSNLSQDFLPIRPHQFILMDENGRLYQNNPGGASASLDGDELQPGERRQGEVSFDLPEGMQPAQLFYVVTPYTNEILQVSLQP